MTNKLGNIFAYIYKREDNFRQKKRPHTPNNDGPYSFKILPRNNNPKFLKKGKSTFWGGLTHKQMARLKQNFYYFYYGESAR